MTAPLTPADPMRYGTLTWDGDLRFTSTAPDRPSITIDGDGKAGPSPVISLLLAAGACAGSDVVDILRKGRVELERCTVDVRGRRAGPDYPRRYLELWLTFRLKGTGLTETNTKRAVELSVTKYCSVVLSLNPDIPVHTEIVIE